MRTRFALVVGLLVGYAGVASAQVREEWVARYQTATGGASAIAVDGNGNVYVTGPNGCWAEDWGGCDHNYVTVKYDRDGKQLWVARYDAAGSFDQATAIAVDAAGNVYVTGESWISSFPDGSPDYATIKYDYLTVIRSGFRVTTAQGTTVIPLSPSQSALVVCM